MRQERWSGVIDALTQDTDKDNGTQVSGTLFGADPRNYDAIRPPYPELIYEFLKTTGVLPCSGPILEIGAGNGLATKRLLEFGATPLTIVEPDTRFAPLLSSLARSYQADVHILTESFETVALPDCHYNLVVAATSFHWIHPEIGLAKIASALKPGGFVAMWWHVFGDPERHDPFHEATKSLLQPLAMHQPDGPGTVPYALDTAARFKEFADTGQFELPEYRMYRWTLTLNTEQVGALYATFSNILHLPDGRRKAILRQLMEIAEKQFGGKVERNMVSPVYVARRKSSAVCQG